MGNAARRTKMQRRAESTNQAPALVQGEQEQQQIKAEDIGDLGSLNRILRDSESMGVEIEQTEENDSGTEPETIEEPLGPGESMYDLVEEPETKSAETESSIPVTVEGATTTKRVKILPTPDESLAAAKKANPSRYAHVISVVEQTQKGEPKRVIIECSDPQTKQVNGQDVSVCEGTREIAVQDLFQVRCCSPCADRKVRKARRNKTKAKNKQARQLIAASKAAR